MASIRNLIVRIGVRDRAVRGGIDRVIRQFDRLNKATDRMGKMARTGGLIVMAGAAASLATALGPAAGGIAGLTLALGGAIAQAAGLAVALPAVAAAWKTSMLVMQMALKGFGDVVGAAVTGDFAKFKEEVKKLPPAARMVATELGGAMGGMQRMVQQAFFEPIAAESKLLGRQFTAPLLLGTSQVAAAFGRLAARAVVVAREARSISFLNRLFASIAAAADAAGRGVAPLLRGLRALAGAFLGVVPKIGAGIGGLAAATGRWMTQIVRTGQAARWFTGALRTLSLLGSILKSLGITFANVFRAATAGGGNLLAVIARGAAALARWSESARGRTALLAFFTNARTTLAQLWRIIVNVGTALGGIFGAASGQAGSLLTTIEQLTGRFAAWTQSAEGQQQLTQAFSLLGQVARDLLTILPGIATVIGTLARWFTSLPGPVRDVVSQFLAWSIFLGLVAGKIAPLVKGLTMLVGGLIRVGTAAGTASAALGRAAAAAGRWAGRMVAAAGRAIAAAARMAAQFALHAARMIGSMALAAGRVIAQWALMAVQAMARAVVMAAAWLISMGPIPIIIGLIIGLVVVIIKNWDTIKEKTVAAFNAVWNFIKKIATFIKDIFMKVHPVGIIISNWNKIKSFTTSILNAVWNFIKKVATGIKNTFMKYHPVGIILSHWTQIKNGAISRAQSLVNWIRGLPGRIRSGLGNLGRLLYGAGRDVLIGLWNGIASMAGKIRSWIMQLVRNIVPGPVRRVLGISSPSKVFAGFGRNIGEGLVQGMSSTERMVARTALGLASAALPQVGAVGVGAMAAPPGLARTGGGAARGELALTARAIGDAVADAFRRAGIKVDMDGREVAEIVSKHTGRATDQRRRTG